MENRDVLVEHRVLDPEGKLLVQAMMTAGTRWIPYGYDHELYDDPEKHRIETRYLPDGGWVPAAVVRQDGKPPVVIVWGTL